MNTFEFSQADRDDRPIEECGVIGVSSPAGEQTAQLAFFGLFALQHRGQEAAGIAVSDGHRARMHKDTGLVTHVFDAASLAPLAGYHAIGHTRYSTIGASSAQNAQPFLLETMHGTLALAHNGSLINAAELREELLQRGFGLTATSDTEVMALMLAAASGKSWEDRLERTMPSWKGAYSLVLLGVDSVVAVRDPWGYRPLSVGRLVEGGYVIASETCALQTLGCVEISEIAPGEIVTIRGDEITRRRTPPAVTGGAHCSFEFVYFSRPDSEWDGRSVHAVRQRLGERLAIEAGVDADVVIPVPDSSIPAAIGYSRQSGIAFNDGLIKNRYIGRTFIEPSQSLRERRVAMKFNALAENLVGKRVIVIDDSLVRGTTAGPLVKLIKDAGATEVHLRITSPPVMHPCFMGVDMGTYDELIAARLSIDELCRHVGCDSLEFLSVEGMLAAIGSQNGYCTACFTGEYAIDTTALRLSARRTGVIS
ncbi:MAG: amidophosphoribosyltransferase [Ilumatobacteraceae bacterium]|nr:amidophosphoribosyltransferase [Ilumatobacteraceae bacterium]MBJ7509226.1 amidophosphoribosyltransferase [Ilumatobacteraceae bacterium]